MIVSLISLTFLSFMTTKKLYLALAINNAPTLLFLDHLLSTNFIFVN